MLEGCLLVYASDDYPVQTVDNVVPVRTFGLRPVGLLVNGCTQRAESDNWNISPKLYLYRLLAV